MRGKALVTALAFAVGSFVGCKRGEEIIHLPRGYEKVVYKTYATDNDPSSIQSMRIELRFRGEAGRNHVVWPDVRDALVSSDLVVFLGLTTNSARLLAAKGTETPVDITPALFGRWSKSSGQALQELIRQVVIQSIRDTGHSIAFEFYSHQLKSTERFEIDSKLLEEMMRSTKAHAVSRICHVHGKTYTILEDALEPELQK